MFLCLFILFNLLFLGSLFCRLEGHCSSYLWNLSPGVLLDQCLVTVSWPSRPPPAFCWMELDHVSPKGNIMPSSVFLCVYGLSMALGSLFINRQYFVLWPPDAELTHWKRPWCWEGLGTGGEGDERGWDGWMASPTRWTWVWVNSGSCWWTGRPGVLWFMGLQRVRHDWATEPNWTGMRHPALEFAGLCAGSGPSVQMETFGRALTN